MANEERALERVMQAVKAFYIQILLRSIYLILHPVQAITDQTAWKPSNSNSPIQRVPKLTTPLSLIIVVFISDAENCQQLACYFLNPTADARFNNSKNSVAGSGGHRGIRSMFRIHWPGIETVRGWSFIGSIRQSRECGIYPFS
ncbi:hypothetical protein CBL_09380 [Carabus blaptoides fortunei]